MRTNVEINNSDDVIDSRDVIARIDELEQEIEDARQEDCGTCDGKGECLAPCTLCDGNGLFRDDMTGEEAACQRCADTDYVGEQVVPCTNEGCDGGKCLGDVDEDSDEWQELKALKALQADAEGSPDWRHGETLIRDSYFETYAQELADDCGMLKEGSAWPYTCIDWERAARELQQDYMRVDFDGVEYWIRS